MAGTDWRTAHVYHYRPDRSGLLLDAVHPLLREVEGRAARAYVVPHWLRGPHLRLNFDADEDAWTGVIRPAVERVLGTYLDHHPSTTRLDPRAALPQHRLLAELEEQEGPLIPWFPDNTIRYPAHVSRAEAMGGERIEELVTGFYVDSNPLYLDTVRHIRDTGEPADLVGLSLLFATAEAVGGLRRNVGSFRSHAEGFIAQCADPRAVRSAFDRQYERHRDAITGLMRAVAGTLDGTVRPPVPLVGRWAALMRRSVERAEPAVRDGALTMSESRRIAYIDHPAFPEYLRKAFGNEEYVRRALGNPDFHRYRVVLNFTYLQLSRLGQSPRTRYLLCHLAANAIEEYYAISAIDIIETFVAEHP
jgi:hypothetical protein